MGIVPRDKIHVDRSRVHHQRAIVETQSVTHEEVGGKVFLMVRHKLIGFSHNSRVEGILLGCGKLVKVLVLMNRVGFELSVSTIALFNFRLQSKRERKLGDMGTQIFVSAVFPKPIRHSRISQKNQRVTDGGNHSIEPRNTSNRLDVDGAILTVPPERAIAIVYDKMAEAPRRMDEDGRREQITVIVRQGLCWSNSPKGIIFRNEIHAGC